MAIGCRNSDADGVRSDAQSDAESGSGGSSIADASLGGSSGAVGNGGVAGVGGFLADGGGGDVDASDGSGGLAGSGGFAGETGAPFVNGTPCTASSQCASAWCVDGVCCDDACTAFCYACSANKKASGADGTCGPIVWADPDDECADEGAGSCGKNGLCSQGGCAKYPDGTLCHTASCGGGYYTPSAMCSGGQCFYDGLSCAPFDCVPGGCKTKCTSNADCFAGFTCNLSSQLCG